MRRNTPQRTMAVVVLTLLLVGAACGSPATNPSAASGPVPQGGTIRIAIGASEPGLNILEYKNHSFDVLDQIYEPLVRYSVDGQLQPALAESWEVSPSGLTLSFHLRRGVRFSDGTPSTRRWSSRIWAAGWARSSTSSSACPATPRRWRPPMTTRW